MWENLMETGKRSLTVFIRKKRLNFKWILTAFYQKFSILIVVKSTKLMKFNSSPSAMNAFGFLLVLSLAEAAYNPKALEYVVGAIEYLARGHPGAFSAVFYDIAPHSPYRDNILSAILESPRLNHVHVAKYVVNVTYHDGLERLPWHPTLLLIDPGSFAYLSRKENRGNVYKILELFNPTTKVWVFVDHSNRDLMLGITLLIYHSRYTSPIFMDSVTMRTRQCNGVSCRNLAKPPRLVELFSWGRRMHQGRKLVYLKVELALPFSLYKFWIYETARYLNTEAVEYKHDCERYGRNLVECLNEGVRNNTFDIVLMQRTGNGVRRNFMGLFTGRPLIHKVAVPRERPLNAVELILLPFTWQVWTLLIVTLTSCEIANYFFPELFKNDPILLVLCGFERHNLHTASRREKIILHSLIILMFFLSQAFETKIISLMVSKPSIQRIKTLDDLLRSDLLFTFDLENNPEITNFSAFGPKVIQGHTGHWFDFTPGHFTVIDSELASITLDVCFDYDRKQPFFVLTDIELYVWPEFFLMSFRNPYLEVFRYTYQRMVENGMKDLFSRLWVAAARKKFVGIRRRVELRNKVDLNFDDMQPAWIVLAGGLSISTIGFLGEIIAKYFFSTALRCCKTKK